MRIKRHTDTDGVSDKRLFKHTVRNASLATWPESHEYVRRRVMYIAYKKHVYEFIYCSALSIVNCDATYFNAVFMAASPSAYVCVCADLLAHTRCMVFEKLQLLQWGRAGDAEMCQRDDATRSELHLCRARLYCMSQNTYYANPYQMVGLFMHHVITAHTHCRRLRWSHAPRDGGNGFAKRKH